MCMGELVVEQLYSLRTAHLTPSQLYIVTGDELHNHTERGGAVAGVLGLSVTYSVAHHRHLILRHPGTMRLMNCDNYQ